ncbi:MFS transporter [Clostridium thailandense]|uniref:MFS transporter n=1 Tax=Clostridium thailandense TaxID=2794346 RepID=UPI0039893A9C
MKRRSFINKWLSWGLPVLAYVICFFHSLSMGVIHESLIKEFEMTEVHFSMISTSYFYIYLFMQIPGGILADTIGPRITVAAGTMLSAVGSLIFGFATSMSGLVTGRLMVGLGVSVIFISIIKIQSIWFKPHEFSTMSGITCFIGTMGGVLAQTPLALIINSLSWRGAFKLVAVIAAIISILSFFLVKDKKDTIETTSVKEKVNIWIAARTILYNKRTWPPFLLYGGFYGTFVIISGLWGVSYMSEVYGIGTIEGSKFVSMIILGSAFGAVAIGLLSDRIQKRKFPTVLYSLVYILLWAGMVFINNGKLPLNIMMIYLFAMGFFSQGFVLSWSVGKEVNDSRYVGMSVSIINIGGFLGSIIIPSITAKALDRYNVIGIPQLIYQKTFAIIFAITLSILVFSLMMKETNCKSIENAK